MGSGSGYYNNQQYFRTRENHGAFVPLCGLLKAEDFSPGEEDSKKLVDEIELKRRSSSQQERLAEYKMRQNLNRIKNASCSQSGSGDSSSNSRTGDNLSPSILGSIEPETNWTPSSQNSSPQRSHRVQDPDFLRKNDLSLIEEHQKSHKEIRDPYASEEFVVEAQGKKIHFLIFSGLKSMRIFTMSRRIRFESAG